MKSASILLVGLLLSACATQTRTVGTFDVKGVVVELDDGSPLSEVKVVLTHEAVTSAKGSTSITLGSAYTDSSGNFYIPKKPTNIVGGSGGLSGYIMEWPTVTFSKVGYCTLSAPYKSSFITGSDAAKFRLAKSENCI